MGSLTVVVPDYKALKYTAQAITCWAGGTADFADQGKIMVLSGPTLGIRIDESIFAANGALTLKRLGANILSGYVPGTNVVLSVVNGDVVGQNPNTCAARTNQPTVNAITMNVGGNPLQITLDYTNAVGAGTVNINWGDGTSTNGAAEAGTPNHTYPFRPATYFASITDASDATQVANFTVVIP